MRSRVLYSWCCIFDIRISKDRPAQVWTKMRGYRIWEITQQSGQYSTRSTRQPNFLFYYADAERSKIEIFRLPFPDQLLLSIPCLHRFIIYHVSGENSFNCISQVPKRLRREMSKSVWSIFNPQTPKVFRQPKTPKGGGCNPPGFSPSRLIFLKIFLMGMFSGSRNPTMIMKKFYLYCMTLKIKVKHLFALSFISPVVYMIQTRSWCRF